MSGTASSSSSQAPARIADAPVPARVRQLLEAVWQAADDVLRTPLQLCMVELERALFQHAEKARNSQIQSDIYAQMRTLREQAPQFPGLFLDALAGQLASFRDAPQPIGNTQATAFKTMTLVEDTDIDRDIVLHEMARREGTRGITALQLLGQRFAVLAAQPAFDIERLPTGPYALCRALREAGERLQLNLESQLALYQVFERQVMDRHTELADRLNILFAREGVLPGLVYRPYLVRPSAPRGNAPAGRDTGNGLGPGSRSAGQGPLTSWQGQAPAASWASSLSQELQLPGGLAGAAQDALGAQALLLQHRHHVDEVGGAAGQAVTQADGQGLDVLELAADAPVGLHHGRAQLAAGVLLGAEGGHGGDHRPREGRPTCRCAASPCRGAP